MKNKCKIPLVSVVLATHNGKRNWLEKALDSVFSQTRNNFEMIIVNDGSTNDIELCILDYKEKHNNIKYIKNEKNLGLPASLNKGIKISKGKYIARIDDDDYWIDTNKLEKQVNFMEKNPDYGLCGVGTIVRIDENDNIIFTEFRNRLSDAEIRKDMLLRCWITHSSAFIRRSVLDMVGLYNPKYDFAEDYELWLRIGEKYKIANLPDISIAYRRTQNSMTGVERKNNGLKSLVSGIIWLNKNKRNYPNFLKAIILKIGAYILGKRITLYLLKKINPNLVVVGSSENTDNKNSILVLNYEFPPIGGGAASVTYDICKGYVDNGFNVDVITMGFKGLPTYENMEGINIHRVKCIRLKKEICHPWEQLTYIISGYFKAKKLLKQKKYDTCHCHFLLPSGILALLLKKQFGLKYFVTSHGSDVPGYNPNRFKFAHKFTPGILKKIINNAEGVISPSKYLSDLIKKYIKGINKNIDIIPNGIDTQQFIPLKKEKILLGTGRLWPLKGLHLLAEAFSDIENPKGFELHICGDGPLMYKLKEIQSKSKNKIVLHGWMNNKSREYIELLGKSMVFCLPSVSENGPISILEGMSSGCTIVTTETTGCLEMSEGIGIYVKPTVESIKNKLKHLMEDDNLCKELGKMAREKAISNYDKNYIIGKYIEKCTATINN